MGRFREKWPWQSEFLFLFLIVPGALGVATAGAFYPAGGIHSLWFLTTIPIGLLFNMTYGAVGRRVTELMMEHGTAQADAAEGLLVMGKIQSPGVVILRENAVQLIPIVGKERTISFDEIEHLKVGHWLPGKFVWGKRAFNFKTTDGDVMAFAVAESVGDRWSEKIPSTQCDAVSPCRLKHNNRLVVADIAFGDFHRA